MIVIRYCVFCNNEDTIKYAILKIVVIINTVLPFFLMNCIILSSKSIIKSPHNHRVVSD